MSFTTKDEKPPFIFVTCEHHNLNGVVYGKIEPHDAYNLGGRSVTFGFKGYRIKENQEIELQKSFGLFGTKYVLLEFLPNDKIKRHKISFFKIK